MTGCPCVAAWSKASRSAAALVMSISSGTLTTGTPRTISIGYVTSVICVLPGAGSAAGGCQRFVPTGPPVGLAAHQGCHDRGAGDLWRLCWDRLTEPGQAIID